MPRGTLRSSAAAGRVDVGRGLVGHHHTRLAVVPRDADRAGLARAGEALRHEGETSLEVGQLREGAGVRLRQERRAEVAALGRQRRGLQQGRAEPPLDSHLRQTCPWIAARGKERNRRAGERGRVHRREHHPVLSDDERRLFPVEARVRQAQAYLAEILARPDGREAAEEVGLHRGLSLGAQHARHAHSQSEAGLPRGRARIARASHRPQRDVLVVGTVAVVKAVEVDAPIGHDLHALGRWCRCRRGLGRGRRRRGCLRERRRRRQDPDSQGRPQDSSHATASLSPM